MTFFMTSNVFLPVRKFNSGTAEAILDDLDFDISVSHFVEDFEIIEEKIITLNMEELAEVINHAMFVQRWL